MQRILARWMLTGLILVLVGCSESEEPEPEADEPTEAVADKPAVVPPLELLPEEQDEPSNPAGQDESAEQSEPELAEEPEPTSAVEIDTSVANAVHRRAGRSAFPDQDETIDRAIAPKRLSDEDQFASAVDEDDIPDVVPWDEAKKYVGYEITVEGKIVDIGQSGDGNVNFLNFHREWRGKFYMVIFDDLAKTLPKSVNATFRGKTVRVTGEVEDHRGRPQIRILSMDQVEFVE
ncbi:MAG: hypothetical protein AAF085_02080 [Planctomycetota bacterium]